MLTSPAKEAITIVCDPMTIEYGPVQPPILIAECLIREGYSVEVLSTTISKRIQDRLESMNVSTIDLGKNLFGSDPSLVWFKSWLAESLFSLNSKKASHLSNPRNTVLNFSNTVAVHSKVWYAQGPLTTTLDNTMNSLPRLYGLAYGLASPFLRNVDRRFITKLAEMSGSIIANSKYLARIYTKMGVKVNAVIYPPLDCSRFNPTALRPSEDYILTYFGKETDYSVVKKVADVGVNITSFGCKLRIVPKTVLCHKNIKVLGQLSDHKLADLYSNALFTFYPFRDEPFGYVPVESMACGTPVLAHNRQGPSESIVDGLTGWLVNSDKEIVHRALQLWKNGYPARIRHQCTNRASFFEARTVTEKWINVIKHQ